MFSGAGNIAAATGLVKKEEFPADLKVSTHTDTHRHTHTHMPGTPITSRQAPCSPRILLDSAQSESA